MGLSLSPQCRWAQNSKFRGTTYTVQHLQEKLPFIGHFPASLCSLAKNEPAGCWHRASLDTLELLDRVCRRELLEGVATDPHLGSAFLSRRWSGKLPTAICEQKVMAEGLPGGGSRLRPAPEAGSGTAALLGPAPRLPAQRADCLPAPDVPLRAAAQRGFSAFLKDRSVPFPSGRFRCTPRPLPDPRQPGARGAPAGKGRSVCRARVAFPGSAGNVKREPDAVSPRALRRGE